ncbi:hypothetical protein EHQ61_18730 [Leptospira wolffii]|nr:hypothetical protein EHQ61_18730 [Leptospira wolffii]
MQDLHSQTDLALRFRNYVILLDRILRDVEEELQQNRSVRNEWSEWNSNWKRVWLASDSNADDPPLRDRFSAKRRIGGSF